MTPRGGAASGGGQEEAPRSPLDWRAGLGSLDGFPGAPGYRLFVEEVATLYGEGCAERSAEEGIEETPESIADVEAEVAAELLDFLGSCARVATATGRRRTAAAVSLVVMFSDQSGRLLDPASMDDALRHLPADPVADVARLVTAFALSGSGGEAVEALSPEDVAEEAAHTRRLLRKVLGTAG